MSCAHRSMFRSGRPPSSPPPLQVGTTAFSAELDSQQSAANEPTWRYRCQQKEVPSGEATCPPALGPSPPVTRSAGLHVQVPLRGWARLQPRAVDSSGARSLLFDGAVEPPC